MLNEILAALTINQSNRNEIEDHSDFATRSLLFDWLASVAYHSDITFKPYNYLNN